MAGKRTEAYALYCRARSLADTALEKLRSSKTADQVCIFPSMTHLKTKILVIYGHLFFPFMKFHVCDDICARDC